MPDNEGKDDSNITTLRVYKEDVDLLRNEKVRFAIAKKSKRVAPNDPELFKDMLRFIAGEEIDQVQ